MTENTAAQPGLTDDELMALLPGAVRLPPGWKQTARAIESALLSKLRAPVADEPAFYINRSLINPETGRIKKNIQGALTWSETRVGQWQMPVYTRAALASAPVAGEAQRLDAPAQVGGTRFGKGIHWSTVIQAAQRHHEYMQDPARESERIAQAKRFQALIAGEPAPQASEAVRNALIPFAAMEESDLIGTAYEGKGDDAEILHFHRTGKSVTLGDFRRARTALSAQPGAQKEQSDEA